ncbi:S8 family serine peptidase [Methanolobus sediminis]|uniref:S8 family serine peptidase n=1 Tax=Methanolobus sediminis TaxID=3072978 RepID=A0AA51YHV7_9EURY|nr:S8 family serine peptidase [Methanolobus sediminis]WMW23845.1 S8 family serine peptidase [Methanolobus sediminis]
MDRYLKTFFIALAISMLVAGTMTSAMAASSKAYSFEDNLEVALPNVAYELPYVPGEIVVQFNPGVSEAKINAMNSKNGATVTYTSQYADFKVLKIPKTKSVEEMVEIYSKNPNVKSASPNSIMYAAMVPDDSYYPYQWNFNTEYGINVEPAWDISTGIGVIVAVLDTGVAKNAPDLDGTSFVLEKDFVNNDGDASDDNGHGTHVTGTIAQSTNNGKGVAGIAYDCSIMPVKVLDNEGSGELTQLVEGIKYATDSGADVISMSLGWSPGYDPDGENGILDQALDYAHDNGVTIVAAAGNDKKGIVAYPAADENCIAVGATDYSGRRAYYSNYGEALDVMAPGGDIRKDLNKDGYGDGILQNTFGVNDDETTYFNYFFYQGTSMATPHVAGVAALLIANGVSGPDNVRAAIENTAKDIYTDGWDIYSGYGIVDAYAALNYFNELPVEENQAPIASMAISTTTAEVGDTIRFDASNSDDPDGTIASYSWDFDGDGNVDTTTDTPIIEYSYSEPANYNVILTVTDDDGAIDTATGTISISESGTPQPEVIVTVDVGVPIITKSAGTNVFAHVEATITVKDNNGNPISGADVHGHWEGLTSDVDEGTTDGNGQAIVISDTAKYPDGTDPNFDFVVDSVNGVTV